jgi:DNA-binding NtrC family response regulator
MLLAEQDVIGYEHLPTEVHPPASSPRADATPVPDPGPMRSLESVERDHVMRVLAACGGNREETSRILGISRRTLSRMIQRWNLPRRLS